MTGNAEKLRKLSLAMGLDYKCPCGCNDIYGWNPNSPGLKEVQLAQRPHTVRAMTKLQKEYFKQLMDKVTEYETALLKALSLPKIETVRRAEIDDDDGRGRWEYDGTMSGSVERIFFEWREDLIGTKAASKTVEPISAVYPFNQLLAFGIGAEKTLQEALEALPGYLTEEQIEAARIQVMLENRYLDAVNKAGATRIRAELGKSKVKEIMMALRRMARNGASSLEVGRWMHKIAGEGKAWYWLRMARSESSLAFDAAFEASIGPYQIPWEQWSASATACPICMQFAGGVWQAGKGPNPTSDTHPNCLVGSIKTYTSGGWKMIKDIKIGDLVLSHRGKFRKVSQLHRHKATNRAMVKVRYFNSPYTSRVAKKPVELGLTTNHPILVDGQWEFAGDVKAGMKIAVFATRCNECNKLMPFSRWRKSGEEANFCSMACEVKHTTKRYGIEHMTENCHVATREMAKNGTHPFQKEESKKKANAACSKIKYKTKHEDILCDALTENNIPFERQVMVKRPEKRRCGKRGMMNRFYKIDVGIPPLKIGIECNGENWHKDKKYDDDRKRYLESKGYTVLEFDNAHIENNTQECVDEIRRVMANHNGEYEFIEMEVCEVEHYTKDSVVLYNLSVEEDESYIAKGFVVYNCNCRRSPKYILTPDQKVRRPWERKTPYDQPYSGDDLRELQSVFGGTL